MKLNNNIEILNGDCFELIKKLPDASVDAIITDPPYFLGMTHNGAKGSFNDLTICKPFYELLFSEYKRVLKPDSCIYFFTDWEVMPSTIRFSIQFLPLKIVLFGKNSPARSRIITASAMK